MTTRPAFQCQGPARNCVIDGKELGWLSCTAYAMAMLIDAATDGRQRPKGCRIRRRVKPRDVDRGLTLRQVARVAERDYDLVVSVRTGSNAISVGEATRRIVNGRGFLLQGNNEAFNKGQQNHAIYVHSVSGGTPVSPAHALVFDPQRQHEVKIPWTTVLAFGAALRLNKSGTQRLGPDRLYAGFPPKPVSADEALELPAAVVVDDVAVRFGATKLNRKRRFRAIPPAGRRVNVRRTPMSLAKRHVVDSLAAGERFVAFQRLRTGRKPPGSSSTVWFGNRDGTEWVHRSGLKRIGDPA